jgi:hypothetical protein
LVDLKAKVSWGGGGGVGWHGDREKETRLRLVKAQMLWKIYKMILAVYVDSVLQKVNFRQSLFLLLANRFVR